MRTYQLAVMGNPIRQSKSPMIHQMFAEELNVPISYERIIVPEGGLERTVTSFMKNQGYGFNVTLPCKSDAWKLVEECSEEAKAARSVNTVLIRENGSMRGENTDGVGLLRDIEKNLGRPLHKKNILVLGAGGAVSGVLKRLIDAQPFSVSIYNRTYEKAQSLASRYPSRVKCVRQAELSDEYDLVINGTSIGVAEGEVSLPERILKNAELTYDMVYSDLPTPFQNWSRSHSDVKAFDGLGMLVEQASESFALWFGKKPDTQSVLSKIRAKVKKEQDL
mgnify:CR=1 FL=1